MNDSRDFFAKIRWLFKWTKLRREAELIISGMAGGTVRKTNS